MGFSPNQESPNHSKRFKFLVSTLKDAFSNCHSFRKRRQSSPEEDDPICDYDDEEEVFISAVISQYMELKCRRKTTITTDKVYLGFLSNNSRFIHLCKTKSKGGGQQRSRKEERDDFYSVASRLSPCSSATSFETFVTAKTIFSRSSSLDRIDFQDSWMHSVIQELSECEGWPFGLYRKALLLPPLPKSPSDSWSWRKSARMVKMH